MVKYLMEKYYLENYRQLSLKYFVKIIFSDFIVKSVKDPDYNFKRNSLSINGLLELN